MVQTRVGPGLGCTRAISSSHAVWFVARAPEGIEKERGFESGDIGRRRFGRLRGNRSVRWTTVDSIRGRTPPPSPTASRRSYGSGPTVGAARVRRFGSCGGVSSSPQEDVSAVTTTSKEPRIDPAGGTWPLPSRTDDGIARAAVSTRGGIDRAITTTCACCDLATPDNALRTRRVRRFGFTRTGCVARPVERRVRSSYASARVAPRQGSRGEGPQEGPRARAPVRLAAPRGQGAPR